MMLAMWVGILVVGCCSSVVVAMWILAVTLAEWGEILVVDWWWWSCGFDGVRGREEKRGKGELICLYYLFV